MRLTPYNGVTMVYRVAFNSIAAGLFAIAAIAAGGIRHSASAQTAPVCGVGNGPLCKTVTVEVCVRWAPNSLTVTLTGGGGGTTCASWQKTTLYYYWSTAGGGSDPKPGLF